MKAPLAFTAALLLAKMAFGQDDVPALLTEGQRAYVSGDLKKAKDDFDMILAIDPDNKVAANYNRMIKAKQPQGDPQQTAATYAAIILPSVELREASLGATLDYLKQAVARQTAGKTAVNFVVQVSADDLQSRKLTLSLHNVPLTEVLKYVGNVSAVTFTYERYAVTVKNTGA